MGFPEQRKTYRRDPSGEDPFINDLDDDECLHTFSPKDSSANHLTGLLARIEQRMSVSL